jgi:hypothetical protein
LAKTTRRKIDERRIREENYKILKNSKEVSAQKGVLTK